MNEDLDANESILTTTLNKLLLEWIDFAVFQKSGGEKTDDIAVSYTKSNETKQRENTRLLLTNAVEKGLQNCNSHQFNLSQIVSIMEQTLFDNFYYSFESVYYAKVCCLCFNLEKNGLYLLSHYDPQILCFFPSEALATGTELDEWRAKYRHMLSQKIQSQKKQNQGIFECPNCRLNNTDYYTLQTRGADEPATVFVQCLNCNKQFKR